MSNRTYHVQFLEAGARNVSRVQVAAPNLEEAVRVFRLNYPESRCAIRDVTTNEQPLYRLLVARHVGWGLERPEMGEYLMQLGYWIGHQFTEIQAIDNIHINPRIMLSRNHAVETAREKAATHILFFDPDMAIDPWREQTKAEFFPEAWQFILDHPGCVAAAPYCGAPPDSPVHVFSENENGDVVRIPRDQTVGLRGWTQIAAIGTGAMLIDMSVFDKLRKPYFNDVYIDDSCSKLRYSQDVYFCLNCRRAKVPVYCNWSTPCGHFQTYRINMPEFLEEPKEHDEVIKTSSDPAVPRLTVKGEGDPAWA